jgi:threonine/homoserine/homoserine lactone efflux protein
MTLEIFISLFGFMVVSTITPGPNNFMLFASGLNFGYRRTIPHIVGIAYGFVLLVVCVGLGLGALLEIFPLAFTAIKVAGALYMIYLAWRIANSGPLTVGEGKSRPMNYFEAAAFQWVNPKAWIVAVVLASTYTTGGDYYVSLAIIAVMFGLFNMTFISTWAVFGNGLRNYLSDPKKLRIFNIGMAVALVLSLWPMLR